MNLLPVHGSNEIDIIIDQYIGLALSDCMMLAEVLSHEPCPIFSGETVDG